MAGDLNATGIVRPVTDDIVEGDEDFTVRLASVSSGSIVSEIADDAQNLTFTISDLTDGM